MVPTCKTPAGWGHLWHLGRGGCACTHVRGSREFSPPPCPSATQPAHIVREKTGLEPWPANQRFAGSIPSPGTCLGCGPGPQYGACEKQRIDVSLAHPCFPPSPSPLLPFSLNINNFFFFKGLSLQMQECEGLPARVYMQSLFQTGILEALGPRLLEDTPSACAAHWPRASRSTTLRPSLPENDKGRHFLPPSPA